MFFIRDADYTVIESESPLLSSPRRDRAILRCCAAGLCILFGYYLTYIFHRIDHGDWSKQFHFGDFPTFYDAGRAVLNGTDPYVPEPHGMSYVYPPMFAVLCAPLAKLAPAHAAKLFVLINLAAALGSLMLGAKEMLRRFGAPVTAPAVAAVALLAGLLAENDLRGEMQQMETDVIMMLMFALALHWLDRRPFRAGAALAFALNIKYLSLVALPYLLLRRRWKAAGGMVGWTVGFGLLPALAVGWSTNLRYLRTALGGLLGWVGRHDPAAHARVHGIADGLSVSVTSAFARQFRSARLPQSYALVVAAALGLACLLAAWRMYARHRLPMWKWPGSAAQRSQPFLALVGLEWAAVIVVALAFSPDSNTRHLSIVALVYTAAATLLLVPRPGVSRGPVLFGTVIAFVGLIMPIPKMFPYWFSSAYFRWSMCSWSILTMYALMLWTGLKYVSDVLRDHGAREPTRPVFQA